MPKIGGESMADGDSVGKVSLDMEVNGDINAQISKAASQIGEQIEASLKNIGNFDFKGMGDNIGNTIKKSIDDSMKNMQSSIESTINKAMSNVKGIKIPVDYDIPTNSPTPKQSMQSKSAQPRAPPMPKMNNSINMEVLKAQIDNITGSLDITNTKIDQQKEKLAELKQSYNQAFDETRKNQLQEQILKTEESINKLTATSDKAGFKLADLDEQFNALGNAARNVGAGVDFANNKIKETADVATKASSSVKNLSNSTKDAGDSFNRGSNGAGMFFDSMFKWGIVFPMIIGGLGTIATFIGSAFMTNTQFANSLNQIKSNLMTAFMPIYQAVLPALNALMSALSTVTAYIASFTSALFGKTYSASFGAAQAMQQSIGAYGQAEKQAKKTADSLGGVSKSATAAGDAAKKAGEAAKKGLAGFDQINLLGSKTSTTPKTATPAGSGVITPITPMANMGPIEAATKGWADKFKALMASLWKPFEQAWATEGQNTINAAKHALQGIEDLLGDIGKSFYTVWTNGTGEKILVNLLKILQDILNIIGDIGVTFANAWNKGSIGTQIVQSLANAFNNVLSLIDKMLQSLRKVWAEEGPTFANIFMQALKAATGVIENVTQKLGWIWDHGGQHAFEGLVKLGLKVGELALFIFTNFVTPFVNWFVNTIAPAIATVLNAIGKLFDVISKVITWLMGSGKPVLDIIITVLGSFALAWGSVTLALKVFWGVVEIVATIKDVLGSAFLLLTSPIGLVVLAIGALIAIGVLLYQNWDTVSTFLKKCWNDIANVAVSAFNFIKDNLGVIVPVIAGILLGPLGAAIAYVATHFQQVKDTAINAWNGIANFMGGLPGRFSGLTNSIGSAVSNGFNTAISYITGLPGRALGWGKDFIDGLVNGIKSGIGAIGDAVGSIANKITSFLHFSVPDEGPLTSYMDWPKDFLQGYANGITNNKGLIANAVKGLSTDMSVNLSASTGTLQQPALTMVGNSSNAKTTNDTGSIDDLKNAIIQAILEAIRQSKENNNNRSNNNSSNGGDLIIKVGESEFARIAIKAINNAQRQTGASLITI